MINSRAGMTFSSNKPSTTVMRIGSLLASRMMVQIYPYKNTAGTAEIHAYGDRVRQLAA